jgi:hypothetical protein
LFQNREDLFFMKNKTKVILGLAAMLAGTAGIAGVSTFAWFATQSTVKLSFTDAVVRGDSIHISVSYDAAKQPTNSNLGLNKLTEGVDPVVTQDKSSVAITGAATQIVDLSGDGKTFYRPVNYKVGSHSSNGSSWDADSVTSDIKNGPSSTYYLSFNVILTSNSDQDTDVYLDTVSDVAAVDPDGAAGEKVATEASKKAAKATRISVWELGASENDIGDASTGRTLWDPRGGAAADETAHKILNKTADGGTKAFNNPTTDVYEHNIAAGDTINAPLTTGDVGQLYNYGVPATPSAGTTAARTDAKGAYICNLPKLNDTKTIQISMWIEGTRSNATEECINGHVAMNLQLIGKLHTA